jgi:hypothetical protein
MITKHETRQFLEKELPKEDYWDKLDEDGRKKVLGKGTEYFFEVFNRGLESIENTLKNNNRRRENFTFLFWGVLLGISGGLIANILHDLLSQFSLLYYSIASVIFLAVLAVSFLYVRYRNNGSIELNKNFRAFDEYIKKKK